MPREGEQAGLGPSGEPGPKLVVPRHVAEERQMRAPIPQCPLCTEEFKPGEVVVQGIADVGPGFMNLAYLHYKCVAEGVMPQSEEQGDDEGKPEGQ